MPRAGPGEPHVYCYLALNVNLHGTSPWHPVFIAETIGVATNASLHGTRPWHLRLFVQSRSRRFLDWLEASFVTSRACREMKIVG